jgi:hypothetical protein
VLTAAMVKTTIAASDYKQITQRLKGFGNFLLEAAFIHIHPSG